MLPYESPIIEPEFDEAAYADIFESIKLNHRFDALGSDFIKAKFVNDYPVEVPTHHQRVERDRRQKEDDSLYKEFLARREKEMQERLSPIDLNPKIDYHVTNVNYYGYQFDY